MRTVGGLAQAFAGLPEEDHPSIAFCRFRKKIGFSVVPTPLVLADAERLAAGAAMPKGEGGGLRHHVEKLLRKRLLGPAMPFRPGDVLINMGINNFGLVRLDWVSRLLRHSQVRYAGFMHDIIPALFPDLFGDDAPLFPPWCAFTAQAARLILCNSRNTAHDLEAYLTRQAIPHGPIAPVRLADADLLAFRPPPEAPSPRPRPYVLMVSTIEPRKNHRLLLEVWRRLLATHGRERVPDLVLVGRVGWRIQELMAELAACRFLDGKIVHVDQADDRALAAHYAHCRFSVYPSLYEGWGLPVAESLAFGKYVVAAGVSAIPEIGGDLIDYHAPTDVDAAFRLIARAIDDDAFLAERERAIRAHYRPTTWADTARAMLAAIDQHLPARQP